MTITEGEYKDLQDADKAIFKLMEILEKKMDDQYHDAKQRIDTQDDQVGKLTVATNALMQIVKTQQGLFRRSMLWIAGVFAGQHLTSASEGLRLILGDPLIGAKPDEDSKTTTQ